MPHNVEAERAILGAVLLGNHSLNAAAQVLASEDFFSRCQPADLRSHGVVVGALRGHRYGDSARRSWHDVAHSSAWAGRHISRA